jgi:DNA-binding LacI/PurR family transcriptional regulator
MQKTIGTTLSDVARRAGVSKNAVSVVINGSRVGTRVSEATRRRIEAAAIELDYRPNAVAQSLRTRRTNTIGFYRYSGQTPFYGHDPFNAAVITGLSLGCHHLRRSLLIHVAFPQQKVEDIHQELTNGKVDGLVLVPEEANPLNDMLAAGSLPVVTIADAVAGIPCVTVDNAEGSRLIAAHLAEKGHRRILYRNEGGMNTSTQRRLGAFLSAAADRGMHVTLGNPEGRSPDLQENEIALLRAKGMSRPTAVVCWNDHVARPVLAFCRQEGLRVPGDIAVVGFDGIKFECEQAYRLTTVHAPWSEVAETAMDLLIDRIEGKEIPAETVLPVSLTVGETT